MLGSTSWRDVTVKIESARFPPTGSMEHGVSLTSHICAPTPALSHTLHFRFHKLCLSPSRELTLHIGIRYVVEQKNMNPGLKTVVSPSLARTVGEISSSGALS